MRDKEDIMIQIEKIYRRRLIPDECILLNNDSILYQDENILVTSWSTLKPRTDFHHGFSCYFLNDGFKISRFYKEDNSFLYWYCDIIRYQKSEDLKSLYAIDMLADIVIDPNGSSRILDLDELNTARRKNLISEEDLLYIIGKIDKLLDIIYNGELPEYAQKLLELSK